jgi:hypothetical protein
MMQTICRFYDLSARSIKESQNKDVKITWTYIQTNLSKQMEDISKMCQQVTPGSPFYPPRTPSQKKKKSTGRRIFKH